jgi:uncharacterized protein YbaP (TraB family)
MKLKLLRIVLALILIFTAAGVQAETSVWVVKSPQATVYLAGSCHVLRASDHPLPAEFLSAYQDSSKIIFEAPLNDMEKPEYLEKLMLAATYSDGTTLKQHLSSQAYSKAEAFCSERNYPIEQYQLFRPWMLAMTLTMSEMARIGAEPNNGVDYFFNEKAQNDRKMVGSLETVDQQIGFLTMMDAGMSNEQITETIDELRQIDTKWPEILKAWKNGDEAKIEALNLKELKNYPKLYQALIVDRNKKWISDIEGYLHSSVNTMVIVGVAHLAGDNSVVDLLRKRGYKVVKLQK